MVTALFWFFAAIGMFITAWVMFGIVVVWLEKVGRRW